MKQASINGLFHSCKHPGARVLAPPPLEKAPSPLKQLSHVKPPALPVKQKSSAFKPLKRKRREARRSAAALAPARKRARVTAELDALPLFDGETKHGNSQSDPLISTSSNSQICSPPNEEPQTSHTAVKRSRVVQDDDHRTRLTTLSSETQAVIRSVFEKNGTTVPRTFGYSRPHTRRLRKNI